MTTTNYASDLLQKLNAYADDVKETSAEFRKRIAALEAPENRDVAINLGARAKLSTRARDGFRDFIRKGGHQEYLHNFLNPNAAMTVGSDPDGGYSVLPEIDQAIRVLTREISPMRQVATVRTISGDELRLVVETGSLPTAAWVGETESRPQTQGSQFGSIIIPANEAYCNPAMSNQLASDNSFDLVDFLIGRIVVSLASLQGKSFVNGTGIKQPTGLTTYPLSASDDNTRASNAFQYIPTGANGTPTNAQLAAALVSASESLRPEFESKAVWLMSRATRAVIRGLTYSGSDSRLLWTPSGGGSPGYTQGRSEELLGAPIVLMSDLSSLSTSNGISIIYGSVQDAYTIVEKQNSLVMQKDPYTQKGYVLYYTTARCGGGASGGNGMNAIKLIRNSST